jgi:hypothetical protein
MGQTFFFFNQFEKLALCQGVIIMPFSFSAPLEPRGGSDFLLQVKKSAKTPPLCRLRLKWHSTMPAPLNSLRSNSTGAFTSRQDTHGFKPFFNGAFAKADFLCAWQFAGRMAGCHFTEVQLLGSCEGL